MLIEQGYSLNESITVLSYKKNIKIILNYLMEGEYFVTALKILKFDNDILLILEISEQSGDLQNGLKKAIKLIKEKLKNKNKIIEKLRYPLVLMIIFIMALMFITNFLIPMFITVYENFDLKMNKYFKYFLVFLQKIPLLLIYISIFLIIIFSYFKVQEKSDRLKFFLKNKFIKKQYYKIYNQIFLINIYTLLTLNLKLDEIFELLKKQQYNYLLRKECEHIYQKLQDGEALDQILEKRKIYNKNIVYSIQDGIQYNTLRQNLKNILILDEVEQKKKIAKYIYLIQPIFYLFFGLIIILLYLSIFFPLFKIMDNI